MQLIVSDYLHFIYLFLLVNPMHTFSENCAAISLLIRGGEMWVGTSSGTLIVLGILVCIFLGGTGLNFNRQERLYLKDNSVKISAKYS